MVLVTRVRCSFRGEDAGSVNSQSYWRDRGRSSAGEQRASAAQTVLRQTLLGQEGFNAGVAALPGADEEPNLEASLACGPAVRRHDAASVRADSVRETPLVRQYAHQVSEQVLVAELECERHLKAIVGDAASVLPPRTSEPGKTRG